MIANHSNHKPEAYWAERRKFIQGLQRLPEFRRKHYSHLTHFLLKKTVWAYLFFPVFIAFWIPLIWFRFNAVALANGYLEALTGFVSSSPYEQSIIIERLALYWFSLGATYIIFDLIVTPFKSPIMKDSDAHMKVWEENMLFNKQRQLPLELVRPTDESTDTLTRKNSSKNTSESKTA